MFTELLSAGGLMSKLDIDEKTFHAYATYVQRERGYKNNWVFVIHKVHFDKWVSKQLRAENIPQEPSQEFLDWLQEYQQNYVKNNPEKVREWQDSQVYQIRRKTPYFRTEI